MYYDPEKTIGNRGAEVNEDLSDLIKKVNKQAEILQTNFLNVGSEMCVEALLEAAQALEQARELVRALLDEQKALEAEAIRTAEAQARRATKKSTKFAKNMLTDLFNGG